MDIFTALQERAKGEGVKEKLTMKRITFLRRGIPMSNYFFLFNFFVWQEGGVNKRLTEFENINGAVVRSV